MKCPRSELRIFWWPLWWPQALMLPHPGVAQRVAQNVMADNNAALDVVQIRPNFYVIAGAGGNIGVQIGPDGVVLVDAGRENAANRDRGSSPQAH